MEYVYILFLLLYFKHKGVSSTEIKEVQFDMQKMLYTNINRLMNRFYVPD